MDPQNTAAITSNPNPCLWPTPQSRNVPQNDLSRQLRHPRPAENPFQQGYPSPTLSYRTVNYLHKTTLVMAGGLTLSVIGHITGSIQGKTHPNNPFCLKGSPLGKTISKLTNRGIDQKWENGDIALPAVNPDAKKLALDSISAISKKIGYQTDLLAASINKRTYQSPNMGPLQAKIRTDIKQRVYQGFNLDPTSGPALQLSMLFLTEIDGPQFDDNALRIKRIAEANRFIDKALASYNLNPQTGNPEHFINAAEALFSRMLTQMTLDPAFNLESKTTRPQRNALAAETAKGMTTYLEGALACQLVQQTNGIWAKRSDYRKQDFWTGLQYVARLGKNIGVTTPTGTLDIIKLRIGKQLITKSKEERALIIKAFTLETFGKILPNLYGHNHEENEPGHKGHGHGKSEDHDESLMEEPGHEGHGHGPGGHITVPEKPNHENHDHKSDENMAPISQPNHEDHDDKPGNH